MIRRHRTVRPPLDHIITAWRHVDRFVPAWLLVEPQHPRPRWIRRLAQRCRGLLSGVVDLVALYGALRLARGVIRILFSI
jgi:hypothetical protein